jgi:hypothetical protein
VLQNKIVTLICDETNSVLMYIFCFSLYVLLTSRLDQLAFEL